ncbi:hypothetical protein GETHLI_27740 [Geothrix limicola]|uniref:Uncharacterized protein n=1 Tax=Geothrix limicola TaxID=2927978 RepID=A0ABQ5QHE7_9BACT|nr:hypothetical protein [Geothrix limicola]GLH74272.1 hypothetical protein GETHLI_27740 [Geothrix limicola]
MADPRTSYDFNMGRPACLLILPVGFYGFGKVLGQELERRGMDVVIENDEFPTNIFGKILGKLRLLTLLRWLTLRGYKRKYGVAREAFDLILIVKGRGVGCDMVAFLRTISRRVVGYNFDSFSFNPSPLDWMHEVDRFTTFDPVDAAHHGLPLVHLFSAFPVPRDPVSKRYDISAIMKNHSQRLVYTDRVLTALRDRSRFIYIFEPNAFSFLLSFFRHPALYRKYWKDIHFKPLAYNDFFQILLESRCTVDYAHPLQTGLTIRCFEARSAGASLVTNNPHVLEHPSFREGEALHFPLHGDLAKLASDIVPLLGHNRTGEARTVAEFMSELLGEEPIRS